MSFRRVAAASLVPMAIVVAGCGTQGTGKGHHSLPSPGFSRVSHQAQLGDSQATAEEWCDPATNTVAVKFLDQAGGNFAASPGQACPPQGTPLSAPAFYRVSQQVQLGDSQTTVEEWCNSSTNTVWDKFVEQYGGSFGAFEDQSCPPRSSNPGQHGQLPAPGFYRASSQTQLGDASTTVEEW